MRGIAPFGNSMDIKIMSHKITDPWEKQITNKTEPHVLKFVSRSNVEKEIPRATYCFSTILQRTTAT